MQTKYLVTLTVGLGLDKDGQPIRPAAVEAYLPAIATRASNIFGGATLTRGRGVWVDDSGKRFDEPCLVVSTVSDKSPTETDNNAAGLADWIKWALNQACVLYTRQEVQSAFI